MIEPLETILVCVSGGKDSVTLLHLLHEMRKEWQIKLAIAHVNHKLRGKASDLDEAFVKHLAQKFKTPFLTTSVSVKEIAKSRKISIEEAARGARYQFFEQAAERIGAQKIALGHTQDDQAETVLMRLVTGTGLKGLQAVRPKRKLGDACLIRPLIEISRDEINSFVKKNSLSFREDKSNSSHLFLRNRIRKQLIPLLERSFNPQVKRVLARLPHLLDADLAFLEETANLFYRRLAHEKSSGEIAFARKPFEQLKPAIQYRLIGHAIRQLSGAEFDFEHWNKFLDGLASKTRTRVQLPRQLVASMSRDGVRISGPSRLRTSFHYLIFPGMKLFIPEINATVNCELVLKRPRPIKKSDLSFEILDCSSLTFPLEITGRRQGDRFQPFGQMLPMKLKKFLINRRIPEEERDRLPIARLSGKIVWIGGVGFADPFKVTSQTKQCIRLSCMHGNCTV